MKNFEEIMSEVKFHIACESSKKIKDKDIAIALNMSASRFATLKKRDSIPYKTLLEFCEREQLSCKRLFFD